MHIIDIFKKMLKKQLIEILIKLELPASKLMSK